MAALMLDVIQDHFSQVWPGIHWRSHRTGSLENDNVTVIIWIKEGVPYASVDCYRGGFVGRDFDLSAPTAFEKLEPFAEALLNLMRYRDSLMAAMAAQLREYGYDPTISIDGLVVHVINNIPVLISISHDHIVMHTDNHSARLDLWESDCFQRLLGELYHVRSLRQMYMV